MRHTASHRVRMNRPSTGGSLLPFAGRCWPSVRRGATAALCPATPAVTRQPEPQPPFQNPRNRPDSGGGDGVSPASARPAALKEDWSLRETPSYPRPPCAQVLGPHASHRPHRVPPAAGHVGSSNHVRTGRGGGGRQPQPIWTTSVSQAKHCSEEETAKPRQADAHNSSHFTFSLTFRVQPSFLSLIPPPRSPPFLYDVAHDVPDLGPPCHPGAGPGGGSAPPPSPHSTSGTRTMCAHSADGHGLGRKRGSRAPQGVSWSPHGPTRTSHARAVRRSLTTTRLSI